MATFTTNQVRQFYTSKALRSSGDVVSSDADGTIAVKKNAASTFAYFEYKNAGGVTRSDLIDIKNIDYAKATDADKLTQPMSRHKLVLDSTVNSGNPLAGQDYVLRIAFRNFIGLSEEDQYFKHGSVKATSGMSASDFYKSMAISLAATLFKDAAPLLSVSLETGGTLPGTVNGTPTLITSTSAAFIASLSGTYTGIVIEELAQPWTLGTFKQNRVNYTIQPASITVSDVDQIWGIATKVTSITVLNNGKLTADMEYFYLGEKGDIYRKMGFPNVFNTQYLVDYTLKYNFIDITYHYKGNAEDVQKSPKTITLAIPKVGATNSVSNVLTNSIITAINTATGLSIATLGVES